MNKAYNFDEFDTLSKKDWLDKVASDLKGKPLSSLNWKIANKEHPPFYTKDDIEHLPLIRTDSSSSWLNFQYINMENNFLDASNDALNNGADGVIINTDDYDNWLNCIKHILPQHCHLSLASTSDCLSTYQDYLKYIKAQNLDINAVKGFGFWKELISIDIEKGDVNIATDKTYKLILENDLPNFRHLMIDTPAFLKINASPAIEIALSLSLMVELIRDLYNKGLSLQQIISNLYFRLSSQKQYFVEIAKLRALKGLVRAILNQYDDTISAFPHFHIDVANTGEHSPLSNTTEAMSSILGGADSIAVIPEVLNLQNIRIARNVSNIIKEESYFDKSSAVADGSYFIESLTNDLAKEAWLTFSSIEKNGGFSSTIENGYLKSLLETSVQND